MFLDSGRKPEYPERNHACKGRTWKLHAERPKAKIQTQKIINYPGVQAVLFNIDILFNDIDKEKFAALVYIEVYFCSCLSAVAQLAFAGTLNICS